MPKFFKDSLSLMWFTREFRSITPAIRCPHCHNQRYLVVHDRIFKKARGGKSALVGQRFYCSNKDQRKGCGRTLRLSLADHIHGLCYNTVAVCGFLIALLKTKSIDQAYKKATGAQQSRNAFRWLAKLEAQCIEYRSRGQPPSSPGQHRSLRCTRILQSLPLIDTLNVDICHQYQLQHQVSFM